VLLIDLPEKTLENISKSIVGETAMNRTKLPVLFADFLFAAGIAAKKNWPQRHEPDRINFSSETDSLKEWCKEGPASGFGL
jgi:hypothetical protein